MKKKIVFALVQGIGFLLAATLLIILCLWIQQPNATHQPAPKSEVTDLLALEPAT